MTRSQLYLLAGVLLYAGIGWFFYGPKKGDFKPGLDPWREGDDLDESRYTQEGLARRHRGRWMGWLTFPFVLFLAELTGATHCFR